MRHTPCPKTTFIVSVIAVLALAAMLFSQIAFAQSNKRQNSADESLLLESLNRIEILQTEIENLKRENKHLRKQTAKMRSHLRKLAKDIKKIKAFQKRQRARKTRMRDDTRSEVKDKARSDTHSLPNIPPAIPEDSLPNLPPPSASPDVPPDASPGASLGASPGASPIFTRQRTITTTIRQATVQEPAPETEAAQETPAQKTLTAPPQETPIQKTLVAPPPPQVAPEPEPVPKPPPQETPAQKTITAPPPPQLAPAPEPVPEPETESLPDKLPEALPDVAPVNITDGAPKTTMAYGAPPNLEARQKYERIMRLLDINETRQFQTEMREWLEENTGDTLEPDALYWLAEAHYVSKQRKQARYYYSRLLERFPKTSRREITLLKLAQLHYDEGEYAHARSILNKLLSSDNSTIRRLAKEQLGRKPPQ